ncbi:hypothetical protein BsWGS_14423 [Bradybaena similaris]
MKCLVAVSLLVTFSCLLPQHKADPIPKPGPESDCDRWVDVAIVGAGAAGTYSAYKLRNANLSIELLELSNRVGGRMYTIEMPDSPDVKIELGTMKFAKDEHSRVESLAAELKLTPEDFLEGRPEQKKYYLRGQLLTAAEIQSGDVPFRLSQKEKQNQGRLAEYYLQELTGFTGSSLSYEQALKLTVQGRPLHNLRLEEALDMVATEEGKELVRALGEFDGPWAEEATATAFFRIVMGDDTRAKDRTLAEGMNKLPERLAQAFVEASKRHQVTFNRKLDKTEKLDREDGYKLSLIKTITKEGRTTETEQDENVCAKKVVLAIPQRALLDIDCEELKTGKVKDALEAVIPVKSSKVFMSFRESIENSSSGDEESKTHAFKSDTPISQMLKWKVSQASKQHILLASYADMHKAAFLEALNDEGSLYPGSNPGQYEASNSLVQEVINHLSEAKGVRKSEFPKPIKVVTQFWSKYPNSGFSTILKAGYNPEDVRQTIQQPILGEEMYIVGSDHASFQSETWSLESALASVDEVYDKYRIDA